MDEPEELNALARKCRQMLDAMTDPETRMALDGLARDYEARAEAAAADGEQPGPKMPNLRH